MHYVSLFAFYENSTNNKCLPRLQNQFSFIVIIRFRQFLKGWMVLVKVSRGKTATSCPDHSLIQFNCDSLVGDNSKKGEYSFLYPPLWMVTGQGRSRKDCRKLSWSPRKTLAFSRNLFFTNSFSIPWSKIKTWKLTTIRTLCFSNTSSPTIVRISSPTAPTSPPWKNAQEKNYAFGDDLPSGCQGARTFLRGSSSAPAPNSFFRRHISRTLSVFQIVLPNMFGVIYYWLWWAWFQVD